MMRLTARPARPVSTVRRNLAALTIASAAVGVLVVSFEPASDSARAGTDLAQFSAGLTVAASPPETPGDAPALEGPAALQKDLELLQAGHSRLAAIPDYSAVMLRQERVGGVLTAEEVMQVKLRHQPFSVYMKWLAGDDVGREVLYVDGQNDGEMLVKLGGVKGRLLPTVMVNPHGEMARSHSRHAITDAGLLHLTGELIKGVSNDLNNLTGVRCRLRDDARMGDRACYCMVREYDSPARNALYRKTMHYLDKERLLPVTVLNYGWPGKDEIEPDRLDEETLLERYAYTEIQTDVRLADRDFDPANARYSFRR